jgi:hypothetical protein
MLIEQMKKYKAHETKIMMRFHGSELASFGRRAAAIAIDTAVVPLLFLLVVTPIEPILIARGWIRDERTLVFTFFGNWYSVSSIPTAARCTTASRRRS